ncbi:hypothetical protein [Clostridium sp.]|uniref:hypothetical protein n=1 Tax=Clostridium sp. TaxID=1506 RepID=UPI0029122452|nr:hypothetical protein [Clostridium sp.]MDU3410122.1 hypothetical protein [Clostridium sp.]
MANLIHFNTQYEKLIKKYGVTTSAEEELFKGKYDKNYIYYATLWADADCEFIGTINNKTSSIKIKGNQSIVLKDFIPWMSLIIKAPIGTNYDILLGL